MTKIQKLSCNGGQLYVRTWLITRSSYTTELPLSVELPMVLVPMVRAMTVALVVWSSSSRLVAVGSR